jgi:serine/threonine protein kinase
LAKLDGVAATQNDLAELMRRETIEPLVAVGIITQVALSLDEAEARKVTHCDIKPDNILVAQTSATPDARRRDALLALSTLEAALKQDAFLTHSLSPLLTQARALATAP